MKQLNLLKNRGERRGLPLMSVSRFLVVVIMLLVTLQIRADEKEKGMYMIVENSVATFYYDELYNDKLRAGLCGAFISEWGPDFSDYVAFTYGGDFYNTKGYSIIRNIKSNILRAVFTPSFSNARPTGTRSWFHGMTGLREIIGLEYLNTGNVTTMSLMFYGCSGLTSLDLSSFNTGNVTDMSYMFEDCKSLSRLDLSSFNTGNVTDMSYMFKGCSNLTSLDLSSFNTGNVTTMSLMFYGCSGLTSLDLSKFNTSNVENMANMFSRCSGLTSLNVKKFNTSNVKWTSGMFEGCSNLTSLDLSSFNTSNVVEMGSYKLSSSDVNYYWGGGMFEGCSSLTSLDLSNFDTSNVENMSYMFRGCNSLTSLDLSNLDTSNVTTMLEMFCGCKSLTNLDLSNFNTSNVKYMDFMFLGCSSLTSLDLSKFNTSNVTTMGGMFQDCSSLTSLALSNFDTSNVKDMTYMFSGCSNLTSLDLNNFDTSNVLDMSGMFCVCTKLSRINLKNFDTKKVKNGTGWNLGMESMFSGCSSLENITIGENVTQMPSFKSCGKVNKIVSYQKEPYAITADCFTDDVKENAKLYVPNNSMTLYKNTDGWKDFKHIVSKDLDTKVEGDSEFKKDDIDENTDFNGNIFSNIFFNIPTESGEYDSAEGCIILKKTTTDEQVNNISGLDLFDEYLLNNFTGMIFMVDAGSGAIELEAETTGEMMLNVKIGKEEPITKKLNGKSKETIEYDVTEPTLVYIYANMPQAVGTQGMRRANSQDCALKIYNIKWGKATGISNIYNAADSEVTIYNLKGQHVKVPGKGLYIVNGKKVVVK